MDTPLLICWGSKTVYRAFFSLHTHTLQSIFHALHETNYKLKKNWPNPTLFKWPLVGFAELQLKHFFPRHPEDIFFFNNIFDFLNVSYLQKKIENVSLLEILLGWPEKRVFWRNYENWPNSVKDSSPTKCQISKR